MERRDFVLRFVGIGAMPYIKTDGFGVTSVKPEFSKSTLLVRTLLPGARLAVLDKDTKRVFYNKLVSSVCPTPVHVVITGLADGQKVCVRVRRADLLPFEANIVFHEGVDIHIVGAVNPLHKKGIL